MKCLLFLLLLAALQNPSTPNKQAQAEAWFAKARNYYQQQNWVKSQEAAVKALEIDPGLADAELLLGLISTAQTQLDTAQKHFEKAVALQPNNDLAQSYLANTYLQQRKLDKAKAGFEKTLRLNRNNQSASYNLGLIGLMEQKPSEALIWFEKIHRDMPTDVPALIGMLESQLVLKRTLEASRSVAELSSLLTPEDPRLFQVATMLALHEDYLSAIPLMERARQAFPQSYDVNFNLALAYFRSGRYEKSNAILKPLLERDSKAEAHNLFGSVQEKLGQQTQAEASFQKAVALEPSNEDFQFDYANHFLQFENSHSAATVFASEVERFPKSWRMRLGLGSAYYLSGKNEQAAQALLQVVQLNPRSQLAYFLMGKIYEAVESAQTPIYEALKSYCGTKPADPWAYYNLGMILFLRAQSSGTADFRQANVMLQQAVQRNPNFAEAYMQLGLIAETEQRWEKAVQYLEKAVQLDPKIPAAHYRLGLGYQRLGAKDKAKAELELFEKLKSEVSSGQDRSTVLRYLAERSK